MAFNAWRKFEKSKQFRRAKLQAKRWIGKEPRIKLDINVPMKEFWGWSISPALFAPGDIVYSAGVGDSIKFDLALIQHYGVEVHAFDPIPVVQKRVAEQATPSAFHFHPWGVAKTDSVLTLAPKLKRNGNTSDIMYTILSSSTDCSQAIEVEALSLQTIRQRLGHSKIALLKIDIEGSEYPVLESLIESEFRPKQLLVEFHHHFPDLDKQMTVDTVARLRSLGYAVASISVTGKELTFIRQDSI